MENAENTTLIVAMELAKNAGDIASVSAIRSELDRRMKAAALAAAPHYFRVMVKRSLTEKGF